VRFYAHRILVDFLVRNLIIRGMAKQMYTLRDIPKYENIRAVASRYPEIDPASSAACVMLLRVASDILAAIDDYLLEHGMSQGRWIVLMLLYRTVDRAQNPCELARKAGVTRATMTGLLDGLEREGLVSRELVAEDRRMLDVKLVAKGRRFLEETMPGYFKLIRRVMRGLSEREKEAMIDLLTKLGASVDAPKEPVELAAT
jgi:DNA-binding MarR family transcriptional regulator